MQRSGIPMKRQMQLPKKKPLHNSYNPPVERKKAENKVEKYAIITSSSLQEQKQLYDDISTLKKEYDTEIEQISLENQNIKEIFINFSAKWIQNLESRINITNSTLYEGTQLLGQEISQFESKFNHLYEAYSNLQSENQDLRNQYQEKSNEFDKLKLQFESFRIQSQNENQEILSCRLNNSKFESENKTLQDQVNQLNFDYQRVQEQFQILNDSYRTLQKEVENKDDLISNLNSQIKSSEHLAAVAEMSQQNLMNENKVLKEKLEMANQMEELLRSSSIGSSELQKKAEEIENLKESINLKDLEIEQLKSHIHELGNQRDQSQIKMFSDQILLKDKEIESLNQRIGELTHKLNQGDSLQDFVDSLSKIADDNEQSRALREQLNEKDEIIKTMETQIQLKDKELSNLEKVSKEIAEKDNLINELQQNVSIMKSEIKMKNSSIEEFKSILKEKEQTISNLTFRLDEKDQMIDTLESQSLTINKEKENNEIENNKMKSQIGSMTKTINSMQIRINELESSSTNDKTNLNEEITKLKDRCHLLDLQNEEKQTLINEKDGQIDELTSRQSLYIQKMREADQLALENDDLKTNFDEQKKQLETIHSQKEELEKNLKSMSDEKNKISLELSQIEYDRNKLLEKVEEYEKKFDKNLEEKNDQLTQYVKELEAQVIELNTKSQKTTLLENQIKSYDGEIANLKWMLDNYKKINEVLQDKLDESNKQNNELISKISNDNTSQFNQMLTSPTQKCTIACSPFKFDAKSETDEKSELIADEIFVENENLKKEIEKWRNTASQLKKNLHATENSRNLYQSECGRLNSILTTNEYDQNANARLNNDKEKEILKLKSKCEKLRKNIEQMIGEKKEINESLSKMSLELNSTKHSFNELKNQHKNFTIQLSNILHKETEQEIIFAVIHLVNSTRCLQTKNPDQASNKIQYFSVSQIGNIESFANQINQKLGLTISAISRIEKKINLASRKFRLQNDMSKISNESFKNKRIPATERKRPLSPLFSKNLLINPNPQKQARNNNLRYVQRENPSNFGDIAPDLESLLFS